MTQRQNKPASNNGSARQSGGNGGQDEIRYFDLITTGIGYLNRVRQVTPRSGSPYWACDINALVGESSATKKPAYRLYQCSIVGTQAFEALDLIEAAMNGDEKATVLISFRLGDSRPDSFNVQKDDGRGNSRQETRYCNKARLLKIMTATVNKIPVDLPQHDQPDDLQEAGSDSSFGNEGEGLDQADGMHDEGGLGSDACEHHDEPAPERQPSSNSAGGQRQSSQRNVGLAPRQPARQSQGNGSRTRAHA